jgi:hypothetical protein
MEDEYVSHDTMSIAELKCRLIEMRALLRECGRAYGAVKQEVAEIVAEIEGREGNSAEF